MNENQKSQKDTARAEVSLWSIVGLLLHKIHWLIAAGLAFGIGVYLVLSLLVTPTFESRVTFYVYNNSGGASQSGSIDKSDLQAAESLATTYSKILESNSVLNAVLSDLNSTLTRKELAQMVDVAVVTNTQLLEVVITSTDANFACKVAESFASVAPAEIVRITKAGGVEVVDHPEVATEQASPRTAFDTAIAVVVGPAKGGSFIFSVTHSENRGFHQGQSIQIVHGSHDNTRRRPNGIYPVYNSRTAIIPRRFRTWRSRIRSVHDRCERIQKMLFLSVLPEINNSFDL